MPHEPGHTTNGNGAQYKIYGTNQNYNGNVVKVGDVFYTTTGNVLEGNSKQLVLFEPELKKVLKSGGFLTRDSRVVERKKYGRRKARRSFQFSKR